MILIDLNTDFHLLRRNNFKKVQNNFIFVDTETYSEKIDNDTDSLSFKMCCSIFWNRDINRKIERTYWNNEKFWIDVNKIFNKNRRSYIMFAHNMDFDFKILDGFSNLHKLGWKLTKQYVRNKIFILTFIKDNFYLHIWDTMNYFPETLKELGKSVGLPKLEVNFDDVPNRDLEIYCKRDTKIIYLSIKNLLNFLERHKLSKLKATKGSLSMNIFKNKFYKPKKKDINSQIAIHKVKYAIKLERDSYRGGISDCFRVGKYQNLYKVDINSMYPKEMRDKKVPIRLEAHFTESNYTQKQLKEIYNKSKDSFGFILDVLIELPQEHSYILSRINDKSIFTYGKYRISLCTPEIDFVEKYGKIIHIYQVNIYRIKNIFKEFITFFNNLKIHYEKVGNKVYRKFCKFIMNTNYGKWSQKKIEYFKVDLENKDLIDYQDLVFDWIKENKELVDKDYPIIYLGTLINHFEAYLINKEIYFLKQTEKNDIDSFVAISSFITSYARMKLIKYLKVAERENTYYSDTDSLIINKKGYNNLQNAGLIDDFELGKLKLEGFGNAEILKPKFYCFDNIWKSKGVRKNSIKIFENNVKVIYLVDYWLKYKTSLKVGNSSKQIIKKGKKEVSKMYDKGKILSDKSIVPFSIKELKCEI